MGRRVQEEWASGGGGDGWPEQVTLGHVLLCN